MSTVDLVLLGMILDRPQSAYDAYKQLQFRNLHHWVKVGKATVFKNLAALEKKGYLRGEVQQTGALPLKTVYHITAQGLAKFHAMMEAQARQDIPLLFGFNAVIANLNKIPKADALGQLHTIRGTLTAKKAFIEGTIPERADIPLVGKAIMRQQVMVLETLLLWIDEFIPQFEREYT